MPVCVAIARLERGDRAPPLAAGGAQRVERGVIALGDIAALRGVDRRRRHQRAGEQVDQRAMAGQRRQQAREQRRRLGAPREPVVQRAAPRRARRAAGRDRAGRRAPRPAGRARGRYRAARAAAGAASRAAPASPSNKATRSSRASIRGAVEQRRAEIGGEQPRAGAGDGAVDRGEQAAGARRRAAETVSSRLSRVAASIII